MNYTDTHTHLFLPEFQDDLSETIQKALSAGVQQMLLPNIDAASVSSMLAVCNRFPGYCYPMLGLHPTSVGPDYQNELDKIFQHFEPGKYIAIGEIGIDLYWDTTYIKEQQDALAWQISFAIQHGLPVVIHNRNAFGAIMEVLTYRMKENTFNGVFHCFTGTEEEAWSIIELGFKLGIGGVVTYKNSGLGNVVKTIPLEYILLETDSPYLSPVPYRGKRNESSNIPLIAGKIADLKNISLEEVATTTTATASQLFNLDSDEIAIIEKYQSK